MEALGAISEGVWSSLSGMYITEEANFMSQLLGICTFPMNLEDDSAVGLKWPTHDSSRQSGTGESSVHSNTKMSNYDSHNENQVFSGNSTDHEDFCCLSTNTSSMFMDRYPTLKENRTRIDLESMINSGDISTMKDENQSLDGNPKKRSRSNGDDDVSRLNSVSFDIFRVSLFVSVGTLIFYEFLNC